MTTGWILSDYLISSHDLRFTYQHIETAINYIRKTYIITNFELNLSRCETMKQGQCEYTIIAQGCFAMYHLYHIKTKSLK